MKKVTSLKRAVHPMPGLVRKALTENNLMASYKARPAYQRNDYIGWINQAKLEATKKKRLKQMLSELKKGTRYMNMVWKPGKTK